MLFNKRKVSALAVALALVACDNSFEPYNKVSDLRVIALSVEPPEILGNSNVSLNAEAEATLATHLPGTYQYTWQFCPFEGQLACLSTAALDDVPADANADAPADLRRLRQKGSVELAGDPNAAILALKIPPFNLTQVSTAVFGSDKTTDFFDSQLASNPINLATGVWPLIALRITGPEQTLTEGVKRLVVGLQDIAAAGRAQLERFGVAPCSPDGTTPPGCVVYAPKVPNQSPKLQRLDLRFDKEGEFKPWDGQPVPVAAGKSITLRPILTGEAVESFTDYDWDLVSNRIQPRNLKEDVTVTWFNSIGTLSNSLTTPKETVSLDNTFTAPKTLPDANKTTAWLWLVLRDQRGGVSVTTVPLIWSE